MTKSDLIDRMAAGQSTLGELDVELAVKALLQQMSDALASGERIEIRGFGSYTVRQYKPYNGRTPRTGEPVHVASKRLPFFKVGKELKEMVNAIEKAAAPAAPPADET